MWFIWFYHFCGYEYINIDEFYNYGWSWLIKCFLLVDEGSNIGCRVISYVLTAFVVIVFLVLIMTNEDI